MSDNSELAYWALLHAIPDMGPVTFRRLLSRFGTARAAVAESDAESLGEVRGVTRGMADAVLAGRARIGAVEREVDELRRRGVALLRMTDSAYPKAFHDLANPPPLLYIIGEAGGAEHRFVGMVGTTRPSDKGRTIAQHSAGRLATAGVTVVSGYAHGVDAASHRGAFNAGGRSILVLPYGIRQFQSRPDFPPVREIAQRGAILSECPPDVEWNAAAAVARDRLIAALGQALFVVETRPKGGTMHTVRAAEQLGRPIFALQYRQPPEAARGNSILIARGATPITRFGEVEKILEALPRKAG